MKFIKVATVASVAAMAATGAFAFDTKQALQDAFTQVGNAYSGVSASASPEVMADLAELMYLVDNHGAVSNVTVSAADTGVGTATALDNGYVLNIETFNNEAAIGTSTSELVGTIRNDFFGSATGSYADASITEGSDNVWALAGVSGHAGAYIDAQLVTSLNNLESDIAAASAAGWSAASLDDINTGAGEVEAAGSAVDTAIGKIELAAGAGASAVSNTELRSVTEGMTSINGVDVRGHVEATDSIVYGSVTGTYAQIVDAYVD